MTPNKIDHGSLTTFTTGRNEITMPVREYEVLLKAQEALNDMMMGMRDAEDRKEAEKLKLYIALITIGGTYKTKIEMTLLETGERMAGVTVRTILRNDGFDLAEADIHIREIEGPFSPGRVLSRYGG